jgi:GNAT superfamily N-acetyltransferase
MTDTAVAVVRRARPTEAAMLSEIAWASKSVWGYPEDWMEKWRGVLEITPEYVELNPVFVADLDGAGTAFVALSRRGSEWHLDHLWVGPQSIGRGLGRQLFRHAVSYLRSQTVPTILGIESEPRAEGFYIRMGAVRVSTRVRDWEGVRRELPYLEYLVTAAT